MNKNCTITQDLLPLYEEELLQPETKRFVDEHLQSCLECRHIVEQSQIPLPSKVKPGGASKKMIRDITVKLTTIQIFFVAIAFIVAMSTTIMNDNSGFILTYAILGAVTYLFYRSVLVAVLLAGIPNFIWNCLLYMTDWFGEFYAESFVEAFQLVLTTLIIHLLFTFIGIVIGFCILKIREEN
ncbi:zf-HC2 domain-containing protein [Ferdinandcohnia quinoae]|uniref:Zf-HC2 domain-containing protein n=1 Tax=Fredinandcohnia quinoae TaxID=2918902 RepID=A0AAW5E542_9BACI|nr:zf-HC2 domain-containing protein [Fredinandcohnia sp. SECRCQ15]MCH1627463.1 zf-HC2 domain-containing protein [Fredinandcohnia sp. SECRCQ15]